MPWRIVRWKMSHEHTLASCLEMRCCFRGRNWHVQKGTTPRATTSRARRLCFTSLIFHSVIPRPTDITPSLCLYILQSLSSSRSPLHSRFCEEQKKNNNRARSFKFLLERDREKACAQKSFVIVMGSFRAE